MRSFLLIVCLAGAVSACQPEAETNNPAVATNEAVNERQQTAPATGATSFTQAQAQDHLISKGYMNPTALVKTQSGQWEGQATLNGETVNVSVDYQGNVTTP